MQMKIPLFKVRMPKEVDSSLLNTVHSGYIGQGPKVEAFEKAISKYIKHPYTVALNNCTAAISLALHLCGVGAGDEVISTAQTCVATNMPIFLTGAKIVWADIDPSSILIDPHSIAKKITSKTKVIVAVDWGGHPADIDEIRKIAYKTVKGKKISIPIIEDSAQSFGASYKGKRVGHSADFTCFSFGPIKTLTTGDGGMLITKSKKNYERARLLRWYGIDRTKPGRDSRIEENIYEAGFKYIMNDIAATIGLSGLTTMEAVINKNRENAAFYFDALSNVAGLTLLPEKDFGKSSYWFFTLRVKRKKAFIAHLNKHGIGCSSVHRRNDTHPVMRAFKTNLPQLDLIEKDMCAIPVGWWVTSQERRCIVDTIKLGW